MNQELEKFIEFLPVDKKTEGVLNQYKTSEDINIILNYLIDINRFDLNFIKLITKDCVDKKILKNIVDEKRLEVIIAEELEKYDYSLAIKHKIINFYDYIITNNNADINIKLYLLKTIDTYSNNIYSNRKLNNLPHNEQKKLEDFSFELIKRVINNNISKNINQNMLSLYKILFKNTEYLKTRRMAESEPSLKYKEDIHNYLLTRQNEENYIYVEKLIKLNEEIKQELSNEEIKINKRRELEKNRELLYDIFNTETFRKTVIELNQNEINKYLIYLLNEFGIEKIIQISDLYLKDKKSAMPIDNKVFKTIFKGKSVVDFIKSIQLKKENNPNKASDFFKSFPYKYNPVDKEIFMSLEKLSTKNFFLESAYGKAFIKYYESEIIKYSNSINKKEEYYLEEFLTFEKQWGDSFGENNIKLDSLFSIIPMEQISDTSFFFDYLSKETQQVFKMKFLDIISKRNEDIKNRDLFFGAIFGHDEWDRYTLKERFLKEFTIDKIIKEYKASKEEMNNIVLFILDNKEAQNIISEDNKKLFVEEIKILKKYIIKDMDLIESLSSREQFDSNYLELFYKKEELRKILNKKEDFSFSVFRKFPQYYDMSLVEEIIKEEMINNNKREISSFIELLLLNEGDKSLIKSLLNKLSLVDFKNNLLVTLKPYIFYNKTESDINKRNYKEEENANKFKALEKLETTYRIAKEGTKEHQEYLKLISEIKDKFISSNQGLLDFKEKSLSLNEKEVIKKDLKNILNLFLGLDKNQSEEIKIQKK